MQHHILTSNKLNNNLPCWAGRGGLEGFLKNHYLKQNKNGLLANVVTKSFVFGVFCFSEVRFVLGYWPTKRARLARLDRLAHPTRLAKLAGLAYKKARSQK